MYIESFLRKRKKNIKKNKILRCRNYLGLYPFQELNLLWKSPLPYLKKLLIYLKYILYEIRSIFIYTYLKYKIKYTNVQFLKRRSLFKFSRLDNFGSINVWLFSSSVYSFCLFLANFTIPLIGKNFKEYINIHSNVYLTCYGL